MFLMIDNYDSFVYNLVSYLEEEDIEIKILRNDEVDLVKLAKDIEKKIIEGIIISPGPKSPKDCGSCCEIVEKFHKKVPIFGVCLGHQIVAHVFGGEVKKGLTPMHGKIEKITTSQKNLFRELVKEFNVTRYHSLVVDKLPSCLEVEARTADGVIMAMSHRDYPIYTVQFHPEAVLTEYGHDIIKNFIKLSKEWWSKNV